jgi:hypothetical protein
VIEILNQNFVSVYVANEDYGAAEGVAGPEERRELQRIRHEGYAKKLSVGTVHAYVLTPDGHAHDSLHIASAVQIPATLVMLERAIQRFKPTPGKPVVPPEPQSVPPSAPDDALILHLVPRGNDRGAWGQFPAENWIVLTRERWSKLVPAGDVVPGHNRGA